MYSTGDIDNLCLLLQDMYFDLYWPVLLYVHIKICFTSYIVLSQDSESLKPQESITYLIKFFKLLNVFARHKKMST